MQPTNITPCESDAMVDPELAEELAMRAFVANEAVKLASNPESALILLNEAEYMASNYLDYSTHPILVGRLGLSNHFNDGVWLVDTCDQCNMDAEIKLVRIL